MVPCSAVVEDDAGREAMAQEGAGDVAPDGWLGKRATCACKVPGGAVVVAGKLDSRDRLYNFCVAGERESSRQCSGNPRMQAEGNAA